MDALTGALVASAVAWGSILLARRVPLERWFGERGLRLVAAASLAFVGLVLVGVPLSATAGWVALGAVAAGAAWTNARRRRKRKDPSAGSPAP